MQKVTKKESLDSESKNKRQDTFQDDEFSQGLHSNYYSPGEIGMFEGFKIEYDNLRQNYEAKLKEIDALNFEKKKLQMQVLNSNQAFYEKEYNRLRYEIDRYQLENQENKHKYLVAENSKKEFESTIRVRTEEVQNLIKQLQKQKVANAELKYQNAQKDRKFNNIVSQMNQSSSSIEGNYQTLSNKASQFESQLRIKNQELQTVQRNVQKMTKRYQQSERNLVSCKKAYDQKNKNQEERNTKLEKEYRELKYQSQSKIEDLFHDVQTLKAKLKQEQLATSQKVEAASLFRDSRQLELILQKTEEELFQVRQQLVDQKKTNEKLRETLKSRQQSEEEKRLEETIAQLTKENAELQSHYESKLISLQQQLEKLKLKTYTNPAENIAIPRNFQQLLRMQIEQNTKIKQELDMKVNQLFNLKSEIEQQKLRNKSLENQLSILRRKLKSEEKNHKIQNQISVQNMKNDIQSLKRKLQLSEHKLQNKAREVKQKDNFITSTIIGRSRPEDVPSIMADLQRVFEAGYVAKLTQANHKIEILMNQNSKE